MKGIFRFRIFEHAGVEATVEEEVGGAASARERTNRGG